MADDLKRVGLVFKADGTVDFKKSVNEVNASIKENYSAFKLAQSQWDENTKVIDKLKDRQKYLTDQTRDYSDKVKILQEELNGLESVEKRDEEAIQKKQKELNNAKTSLNNYQKGLEDVERQLKSGAAQLEEYAKKVENVGKKASDIGSKMLPATAAIVGAGTASAVMASNFEDAMAKVSTIADETEVPLEDLKSEIMSLSNETGIAATDIADNVYNAISAGQSTGDAVNFVSNATKLAKSGFTESSSALDILTTAMNAYGMEASEVTKVSDLLIQTQNLGKTTVGELSSSMGKVIPTAKANGVGIEQLCASYAILTANGIATAESTTYMNSMLNELGKGGTKVDAILREKTGKSFSELSANGKSVGDVLQILSEYADGANVSFSDLWSSSEAGKAGLVLLGSGADVFNGKLEEMKNSSGATDAAFGKLDTTSNKAKITINELKNTAIELGDTLLDTLQPILTSLSENAEKFSKWFSGLNQRQKETIIVIAMVVASIGPLLIIFGKMCTGISAIIKVVKIAKPVIAAFNATLAANPAVIIVMAIIALIAILVTLYNKCEWFRDGVNGIFETIVGFFTKTIPEAIQNAINWFKENWQGLLLLLVNPFVGGFKLLYDNCEAFRNFIDGIVDKIGKKIGKIKDFFVGIGEGISDTWKKIKNIITTPHFKTSGKFSLSPLSVPSISVDWYAKGGILNSPTIFGANGGKLLGGGEAGKEAVLPIELLRKYISQENQANNSLLVSLIKEAISELQIIAENNVYIGDKKLVSMITDMVIKKISSGMNDTRKVKGCC